MLYYLVCRSILKEISDNMISKLKIVLSYLLTVIVSIYLCLNANKIKYMMLNINKEGVSECDLL